MSALLQRVAEALTASATETCKEADIKNKSKLDEFLLGSISFIVFAQNDVKVVPNDVKLRKADSLEGMRLIRYIKEMEVAANFLREYCHASSTQAIVILNKASLRTIYAVDILFRQPTLQFREMSYHEAGVILDLNEVKCGDYKIVTFMSGKVVVANHLATNFLRIGEK